MHTAVTKPYGFEFRSFRQTVKAGIGEALAPLLPGRTNRLSAKPNRKAGSLLDRLLMQGLIQSRTRAHDHAFFARLHRAEWEAELCEDFCDNTSSRFKSWFLDHHVVTIDALEQELASNPRLHQLVEVGCGAGQVTHYLADRFPQLRSAVGIDICPNQIEHNNRINANEKVRFVAGDGLRWVCDNTGPDTVLVTNGGVLEYFAPAELDELFGHLQANWPSVVTTIEPFAFDHDLETQTESRPFGEERSFSHNYPAVLRRNGFEIAFQDECVVDEYRFMMLVSRG